MFGNTKSEANTIYQMTSIAYTFKCNVKLFEKQSLLSTIPYLSFL